MKFLLRSGLLFVLTLVVVILVAHVTRGPLYASDGSPHLSSRFEGVRSRVVEIEQTWQGQYEGHFGSGATTAALTADEIAATLARLGTQTDRRLGLIYVFPQPNYLELVLVTPDNAPIRKTLPQVSRQTLLDVARAYESSLIRSTNPTGYLAPSQQLYRWILSPLEAELQAQEIDTLVFCVGAGLRSLPLAALHDGQQFLIEKYSLGRIPAFTLTDSNYRRVKDAQVLAMGASEFQQLSDLPAVPLELAAIAQDLWPGQIFLNQEFTLTNLQRALNTSAYAIVHLATHAQFRPGKPNQSYIQLWQNEQLSLDQMPQLNWNKLPVELLVLSACQTALGDAEAELGFAGLSFRAGVKSSLASLWLVNDAGTLALMQEFYWQMTRPEVTTKAEALQKAQIALLQGQVHVENSQLRGSGGTLALPTELEQSADLDLSHPYYWAAFTLVGSPW